MPDLRKRSRSPEFSSRNRNYDYRHRSRSRSPYHSNKSHKHHLATQRSERPTPLPLNASSLTKYDLSTHRPLFALYLDVQKQIDVEILQESEVKGRWKSFVKKWNNGDLAEGWYDTKTFEKAQRGTFGLRDDSHPRDVVQKTTDRPVAVQGQDEDEDEDDDDFGPSLPTALSAHSARNSRGQTINPGPTVPSFQDIRVRNEQARDDAYKAREQCIRDIQALRKTDREVQKDRLEELIPRAEAGTRERQLEKKQEVAASNRAFAAAKDVGGDVDLKDSDVMGEDDSLGDLKRMKEVEQRKRTEREVRREEILRARVAEREERMRGLRDKEAKTMEMLKNIAKARFGGVNDDN